MSAFVVLDSISLVTPDGRPLFEGLTLALAGLARPPRRLCRRPELLVGLRRAG